MTDTDLQQKRLIAAGIDSGLLMAVGFFLSLLLGAFGVASSSVELIGEYGTGVGIFAMAGLLLAYVLGRDLLAGGRSVGKRVMGIRVLTEAGGPIGLEESIKRNVVFAPPFVLFLASAVIGLLPLMTCGACLMLPLQLSAAVFALGAGVYELVQIVQEPDGVRQGDKIARTRVVA